MLLVEIEAELKTKILVGTWRVPDLKEITYFSRKKFQLNINNKTFENLSILNVHVLPYCGL